MTYQRLRVAREEKGWSLEELSQRTGISQKNVEMIDRGDIAGLPAGLYGRSAIRRYAAAVGLDCNDVLESLGGLVPAPEDPLDGLARRCGHARKSEPRLDLPADPCARLASADPEPAAILLKPATADIVETIETSTPAAGAQSSLRERSRTWWRPLAASAIDGVVLAVMGAALLWLTTIACGTSVAVTVRIGAPAMALVFALIVALYFVLFGGVGNATLGVSLMGLDEPRSGRIILNPRDVFGRARRSILPDSSLLAE